jgi:SAM-dependent methyltransferase
MDATYTSDYEQFELRHWWFVARRQIIHDAINRYVLSRNAQPRWLDVGCGTGVLLDSLPAIANQLGLELDGNSVARARAKGLKVEQIEPQWDLDKYGSFDLITLTDVIEHLEDDRKAIEQVHGALNPGGIILVTVPALMSLWSGHDVINHHFRRYTQKTLLPLFADEQWKVLKVSYFSSLLLPLIWMARKWKNLRSSSTVEQANHDFKFGNPLVDGTLLQVFRSERFWLSVRSFPLGSSILLVAQRK